MGIPCLFLVFRSFGWFVWVLVGLTVFESIFCAISWVFMGFHAFPRLLVDFRGLSSFIMGFRGVAGFWWVFRVFFCGS